MPANVKDLISINKSINDPNLTIGEKVLIAAGMAKTIDTAASTNISGAVDPMKALTLNTLMVKQDEFLRNITTTNMKSTKLDLDCLYIAPRQTKRPSPIVANMTDTDTNVTNVGNSLELKRIFLRHFMSYELLQERAWQPGYQAYVQEQVLTAFGNDIADLAFNGTNDNYGSSLWVNMNKGFPTLFAADSNVNDVTFANYDDRFDLYLAMVKAMPSKFRMLPDMCIFDSFDGVDDWWAILGNQDATAANMQRANDMPKFGRYPIIRCPYLPAGKAFMAPKSTLHLGLGTENIRMTVKDDPEADGVKIIIATANDYNYVNGTMIVYAS